MSERSNKPSDGVELGPRDMTRLIEALPPHAPGAEMSLLGAMLWDHKVIPDVISIVGSGADLYKPAHGSIFDAMIELYDKHGALDVEQLAQFLVDRDILEEVGGIEYIAELAESVPSASNALQLLRTHTLNWTVW